MTGDDSTKFMTQLETRLGTVIALFHNVCDRLHCTPTLAVFCHIYAQVYLDTYFQLNCSTK